MLKQLYMSALEHRIQYFIITNTETVHHSGQCRRSEITFVHKMALEFPQFYLWFLVGRILIHLIHVCMKTVVLYLSNPFVDLTHQIE